MPAAPSLYLGIDTGGTYTDGVLLDPAAGTVLASAKVPTTHHDLRVCIAEVLRRLLPADATRVRLVSLSTTLATNAIAEGKNRPVGLFLLGYDQELLAKFQLERELASAHVFYIQGGHNLEGQELAALDETALLESARRVLGEVEAFAVSGYAGVINPAHEERAGELLSALDGRPVVQGHHLTSSIGSIRRAATAALNAALIPEAYAFLQSVQAMLAQSGISCPLVMVKGDGALAGADYAARRPVEIIHSGPATSAIGGAYLAGVDQALVVDVGGTTTDLALVGGGRALLADGEASVGGYRTCVRTIHARSFGLGGDSLIHFDPRKNLTVGPQRVIPLSFLASQFPAVGREMRAWLLGAPPVLYSDRLEYWMLLREPSQPPADPRTRRALELLREGPMRASLLLKAVGAVSAHLIDRDALVRKGILARAALTPTDLLHVTGEYAPWDVEVARLAAEAAARLCGERPEWLASAVKTWMAERIASEIVQFLSGKTLGPQADPFSEPDFSRWAFEENLTRTHPYLGCRLELKLPLVGIGAPARVFLPPVAEILGAQILFPEHYQVANAVGTVVGSIFIRLEAEITPRAAGGKIIGYDARAANLSRRFTDRGNPSANRADALAFAREALSAQALAEAQAAGAANPTLEVQVLEGVEGFARLVVSAIGKPGLREPAQS